MPDALKVANIYATVEETDCLYVGQDMTGQLQSCSIVLRGMLIEAVLYYDTSCRNGKDWKVSPVGREETNTGHVVLDTGLDAAQYGLTSDKRVYCLKMVGEATMKDKSGRPREDIWENLTYLILGKVVPSENTPDSLNKCDFDTFERMGLFRDGVQELEKASEQSNIQRDILVKIV